MLRCRFNSRAISQTPAPRERSAPIKYLSSMLRCRYAMHRECRTYILNPRGSTACQSQRAGLSRSVLAHESRPPHSRHIFSVLPMNSVADWIVLIPAIPVLPFVLTWWLPWERWIPWSKIPKVIVGPYLGYLAFVAFYFGFHRWAVVAVAVSAAVTCILEIRRLRRVSDKSSQQNQPATGQRP